VTVRHPTDRWRQDLNAVAEGADGLILGSEFAQQIEEARVVAEVSGARPPGMMTAANSCRNCGNRDVGLYAWPGRST